MKKWEKEILQKQIADEKVILRKLQKSYLEAIEEIKGKVAILKQREQSQSVIYQKKYQEALLGDLKTVYNKMYTNWYADTYEYLQECYEGGFYATMYSLHQEGIPIIMPFNQPEALQAASIAGDGIKLSKKLYDDVTALTELTMKEITRGIAMNSSYADIARSLEKQSEATLNQSYCIVRTESHRLHEEVKFKTVNDVKAKGADIVKQWDAAIDSRTRPSHAALDGQLQEIEDPYKSPTSGKTAMYPGGFGIPYEDINCRCASLQRARWALDKSELDKCVGNLDNATDGQLQAFASNLGVNKEDLIKASNGIIESDGSINHSIKAQNYNEFKTKYERNEGAK